MVRASYSLFLIYILFQLMKLLFTIYYLYDNIKKVLVQLDYTIVL